MVSKTDYEALLKDHPRKFKPSDVGFGRDEKYPCASCIHFYTGVAMERNVCEIMRPKDEIVPWNWSCKFHTTDGEHFPKLEDASE